MKTSKIVTLIIVLLFIVAAIFYIETNKASPNAASSLAGTDIATSTAASFPSRATVVAQKSLEYPRAKELVDPTGFINTPGDLPITISQYIGKDVILIDFWTYSCINCQRVIPYWKIGTRNTKTRAWSSSAFTLRNLILKKT